jgi:hypothetical protein
MSIGEAVNLALSVITDITNSSQPHQLNLEFASVKLVEEKHQNMMFTSSAEVVSVHMSTSS